MVIFGAYHSAQRFSDADRLATNPGPGSYPQRSVVEGAPVLRYARKLVEDGCVRPDGSLILFRGRDSWVRGGEGPKGLTSLSVDNAFIDPSLYRPERGDRLVRDTIPAAFLDNAEARYLSPSQRCLTADHERAAKGSQSPGPGNYYPFYEAWDFAPPESWDDVNKNYRSKRRGFNAKTEWGDAAMVRPPTPALAAEVPNKEERMWLRKRRGSLRPSTSPRCMWVKGVTTTRGLQAWGNLATKVGPISVVTEPVRGVGSASERRGPVHSSEVRATSPTFREVRYLDRELTRRGVGVGRDTPGPGSYNVRPRMIRGTKFASSLPGETRAAVRAAAIKSAKVRSKEAGVGKTKGPEGGRFRRSPPDARSSQRLPIPLRGRESPGPAYSVPGGFDIKLTNRNNFHPPCCTKPTSARGYHRAGRKSKRGCIAAAPAADSAAADTIPRINSFSTKREKSRPGMAGLSRAREYLVELISTSLGVRDTISKLAVPVSTSMGRGFLLAVRADGMSFVRLPWGVLYTAERLASWGKDLPVNAIVGTTRTSSCAPLLLDKDMRMKKVADRGAHTRIEKPAEVPPENGRRDTSDGSSNPLSSALRT